MSELEILQTENAKLREETAHLKLQLEELKRMIFGRKSERFISDQNQDQLTLFEKEKKEQEQEQAAVIIEKITYSRKKRERAENKESSHLLPAHLPRVEEVIEPAVDTSKMVKMGELVTEYLEYKPSSLYVRRIVRPKYVQKVVVEEPREEKEEKTVIHVGELPPSPIHKSKAGSSLLASILVDKFEFHLPLYRQMQRFKYEGVEITKSTIGGWTGAAIDLLSPLYDLLVKQVLDSHYIQADETPIKILESEEKGASHKGYLWAYNAPNIKTGIFDYRTTRNRSGPQEMLKEFKGYLQVDGYAGYEKFDMDESIQLFHCMAHARRKYENALDNDHRRAKQMLSWIQELYVIEQRARDENLSYEQRKQLRQKESTIVLDKMEQWLKEQGEDTSVKASSAIGKAISYMTKRWHKLCLYTSDGRLEIDNNLIENSIRPIALGRKNYLFAGSHDAAQRIAVIYTLIANAKINGVNTFEWLNFAIANIYTTPEEKLQKLLPQNFKNNM